MLGVTGYRTLFSWFTVKRFTNKLETPYTLKVGLEPTKSAPSLDGSVYQFHHFSFVPTSGNDPLWKYLWDIFDHLIKSAFEESIVFETNPFYRAIALAGHPNTLSVYFPFCTPRKNWTSISSLSEMCANHSTIGAIFADLTGLEPAILGLTNLRCIPLKLQINLLWTL